MKKELEGAGGSHLQMSRILRENIKHPLPLLPQRAFSRSFAFPDLPSDILKKVNHKKVGPVEQKAKMKRWGDRVLGR